MEHESIWQCEMDDGAALVIGNDPAATEPVVHPLDATALHHGLAMPRRTRTSSRRIISG
jgi:hypothetical protein